MRVNLTAAARRVQWHIDHINKAPTADEARARARRFELAEFKALEERRPEDVDTFRRHLAYVIADFVRQMPTGQPDPRFRESMLALPGGGWTPVPHKGRAAAVEHP